MNIVLYSTGCPQCTVLEKKLVAKNISYEKNTDIQLMLSKGIKAVPVLEVDGQLMNFKVANDWIKGYNTNGN